MSLNADKLLIFDIKGPAAHFRKFYTNSSSLSYTFPPRTTITGLIAGILGRERDKYYEDFSTEKCKIAVSVKTPVRKIMQTVNYVNTAISPGKGKPGGIKAVNLSAGRTQIPLEIVLPFQNFYERNKEELKYRIYFFHKDDEVIFKLKEACESNKFVYPPYLGISEFIAKVNFVDFIKNEQIQKVEELENPVEIATVINVNQIPEGGLDFGTGSGEAFQYVKERMPLEFNPERKLEKAASFVYEKNQKKIRLKKIIGYYYKTSYKDPEKGNITEDIVFMES